MVDGWGRMGRSPETTAGWREEIERDERERAEEDRLANQARPTRWVRLRRRFRRFKG